MRITARSPTRSPPATRTPPPRRWTATSSSCGRHTSERGVRPACGGGRRDRRDGLSAGEVHPAEEVRVDLRPAVCVLAAVDAYLGARDVAGLVRDEVYDERRDVGRRALAPQRDLP